MLHHTTISAKVQTKQCKTKQHIVELYLQLCYFFRKRKINTKSKICHYFLMERKTETRLIYFFFCFVLFLFFFLSFSAQRFNSGPFNYIPGSIFILKLGLIPLSSLDLNLSQYRSPHQVLYNTLKSKIL